MTLYAAHLPFRDGADRLLAEGTHLYPALQERGQRPDNGGVQQEKLTGVGLQDCGNRTGLTKVCRPFGFCRTEKTAFFILAPTEIISVKIFAFFSSRSSHPTPLEERAGALILTNRRRKAPRFRVGDKSSQS